MSRPVRNLALATLSFALCFSAWGLIAPLASKFQDELDLSSTETYLLTAVPVVLGSLLRIPVGLLTDHFGGRRMFAALLLVSAVPAVQFGFASGYWTLLAVGFLLGVAGSSFAVGVPFVAGWFPAGRQGLAVGIYGTGNIGTAVAAFTAPVVVSQWGRPALGLLTGAVLTAGGVLFWSAAEDPPRMPRTHYPTVLRSGWRLYRLAVFYFVTFGGFVAVALLLPKLLRDWFEFSLVDAGLRAAGFTLVATVARPVGGWLADRFGAYPVLVLAFAGIAVDAAVLATAAATPRIVPITIAFLSLGAFLGGGSGAVFKLVPAEFPRDAGSAAGIVGAAGGLGGFFPPLVMGAVKDVTGTYTLGFVGLLTATAACLGLAVWLLRTAPPAMIRGHPHEEVDPMREGSVVSPCPDPRRPGYRAPAEPATSSDMADEVIRSGDALFAVDTDMHVVSWNPAAEQLTGIPAVHALGRPCWDVLHAVDENGAVVCHPGCSGARLAREGWPVPCRRLLIRTKDGQRLVFVSTISVRLPGQKPLVLELLRDGVETATDDGPTESTLTPRQLEVLRLLADGIPAKLIARRLGIAEVTVRNHIRAILSELHCHSQLEAVAEARRRGLVH